MVWVWVLFVSFCIPEVFTFLRSMRMVCFKSPTRATAMDTLIVIAMESMSMVGLGLLAFYVWPNLDVIKGAMLTNCVAFTPGNVEILTCFHGFLTKLRLPSQSPIHIAITISLRLMDLPFIGSL